MTIFYEIAKESDLADDALCAALLRSSADIIALEADKRPDNAALAKLKEIAGKTKPARATALLQPIDVLKEADIEYYLAQTAWDGIDNFGFIAPDYKIADAVLTKYVNPKTIFAYLKVSLIIPFSPSVAADFAGWLAFLKKWGFPAVILRLEKNLKETGQSRAKNLAALGECLELLQNSRIQAGVDGDVQPADLPRLLLFYPAILGVPLAEKNPDFKEICRALAPDDEEFLPFQEQQTQPIEAAAARQKPAAEETAAGAAEAKFGQTESPMPAAETDKILVSDYIVPMRIGAYQHEKGAPQRVCFNVAAEITRLTRRPRDMSDIFSYDIILDAITRLAEQKHWEFVESAAEELAADLLRFPRVERVMIRVEKLDLAPRAVGVEICRRRV